MKLDTHCLKILGQLASGDITYQEAEEAMSVHGDQILRQVFENGFTVSIDAGAWRTVIGSTGDNS